MKVRNTLYSLVLAAAVGIGGCTADKVEDEAQSGIELKVNLDELKKVQSENATAYATENTQYWQNKALINAERGEPWSDIEANLRIAGKYAEIAGLDLKMDIELLKTKQTIGKKTNGQKNVQYWLDKALKDAKKGEDWSNIESDIRIAGKYAKDAGITLVTAQMDEIKQVYVANKK